MRDVAQIVRYQAADLLCVKPARVGGLANARTIVARAREAGLRPYVGGFFESPYARHVHRALARSCVDEPSDLGPVDVVHEGVRGEVDGDRGRLRRRPVGRDARRVPSWWYVEVTSLDSRHGFAPLQTTPGGRATPTQPGAREPERVLEEQVMVWNDALEDSRIRALVSETPLQVEEYDELSRHVAVANAEMKRRVEEVRELVEASETSCCESGRRRMTMDKRVVIADDESIIRLDLKEILEGDGYLVVGEAARGDDALAMINELEPDLALLDVKMPGLDGIEVATALKGSSRSSSCSRRSVNVRSSRARATPGVVAYLVKPFRSQ